jgi:hypothetical protein
LAANKEVAVAAASWWKYAYLAHFSRPRTERPLFRLVKRHKICRIVEIGIQDVARSVSLVNVAERYADQGKVSYTGLDWFDSRSAELPQLTLKQAHRQLQATDAVVRLVPGEPGRSVGAIANAHPHTGLLILGSAVTDSQLVAAWFYLPRMVDAGSVVLRERIDSANRATFERLPHSLLIKQAAALGERRAA